MYNIEQFQALNKPECFVLTQHSRKRLFERGISIEDVEKVFNCGQIIEDYPDDFPFPSCLVFAMIGKRAIHVCASISDGFIYLITAYIPDSTRWKSDYITRKK